MESDMNAINRRISRIPIFGTLERTLENARDHDSLRRLHPDERPPARGHGHDPLRAIANLARIHIHPHDRLANRLTTEMVILIDLRAILGSLDKKPRIPRHLPTALEPEGKPRIPRLGLAAGIIIRLRLEDIRRVHILERGTRPDTRHQNRHHREQKPPPRPKAPPSLYLPHSHTPFVQE